MPALGEGHERNLKRERWWSLFITKSSLGSQSCLSKDWTPEWAICNYSSLLSILYNGQAPPAEHYMTKSLHFCSRWWPEKVARGSLIVIKAGPYITFSIWGGGNVIRWSSKHDCPEVIHPRGVWGYAPPGNFDEFRCSEAHSGALWGIQRSTQSFLRRGSSSKSSLLAELLEHWKPSPSARVYYPCLYIGGAWSKFEV